MTWYLGSDPEFFLQTKQGLPVPAHKHYEAKADVLADAQARFGGFTEYGTTYRDGYAVELNPNSSVCRESLTLCVGELLRQMRKHTGLVVSSVAAVPIALDTLVDAPTDVKTFGCDPALDAYTGAETRATINANDHPYRYAGGHLHISSSVSNFDTPAWIKDEAERRRFVKMLDLYVGIPLTYWYNDPLQFQRRLFYGKAGEYRFQTYGGRYFGVEYRTPPPAVWNNPVIASYALGVMRHVATAYRELAASWNVKLEPAIRAAINTGEGVTKLLKRAVIGWNSYKLDGALSLVESVRDWAPAYVLSSSASDYTKGWDWYRRNVGVRNTPVKVG